MLVGIVVGLALAGTNLLRFYLQGVSLPIAVTVCISLFFYRASGQGGRRYVTYDSQAI